MKLHHIGIACADIETQLEQTLKLHPDARASEIIFDPEQDARLCMVEIPGSHKLELIQGSPVASMVEKNIQLYHLCYATPNLEAEMEQLAEAGALQITPVKPAVLFGEQRVVFFLTPSQGIIELVEVAQ